MTNSIEFCENRNPFDEKNRQITRIFKRVLKVIGELPDKGGSEYLIVEAAIRLHLQEPNRSPLSQTIEMNSWPTII